jgi:gamma-glutamyl-gamma-aminobutyrate hydrolase PuuD
MPGTLLGPTVDVPCYHHQAIDLLGDGLKATAWALDETVEAVWNPDHSFLLGVQWHPEARDDPALFAALVRAASAG